MDSRYESEAASKSKKVRFRCDQTRQFRVVADRGVGSFVQAKRIRHQAVESQDTARLVALLCHLCHMASGDA